MSKHTPGPWRIQRGYPDYISVFGKDRVHPFFEHPITKDDPMFYLIAVCSEEKFLSTEVKEANARLIAAAPEILEALKAARDEIHRGGAPTTSLDAAIAKAEGRSE